MAWFIPLALAAVQLGTAAYQGIKGARQKREARALQTQADQQERSNLADARRMALVGMPESQYEQARSNINRQEALGLASLRDRRSALAGISAIQQNTNDALISLAAEDARQRRAAENAALNQANRLAGITGNRAQDRQWSGEALTGAAIQNAANAASTFATSFGGGKSNNAFSSTGTPSGSGLSPNGYNFNSSFWGPSGYRGFVANNANSNPYARAY